MRIPCVRVTPSPHHNAYSSSTVNPALARTDPPPPLSPSPLPSVSIVDHQVLVMPTGRMVPRFALPTVRLLSRAMRMCPCPGFVFRFAVLLGFLRYTPWYRCAVQWRSCDQVGI